MKYLYFLTPGKPKTTYDAMHCCQILEMYRLDYDSESPIFICKYRYDGQVRKRKVFETEGTPYDNSCAFYLNDRDDDKAKEIFSKFIQEKRNRRKNRVKEECHKILCENELIHNIPNIRIHYN